MMSNEQWAHVPIEPTDAMMDAMEACSNDWPRTTWRKAWAAACAAAPKPTDQEFVLVAGNRIPLSGSPPCPPEDLRQLGYELDGVIIDTEQGGGFDAVCLNTVKRVRRRIAELTR
jgi:hypothetical protein